MWTFMLLFSSFVFRKLSDFPRIMIRTVFIFGVARDQWNNNLIIPTEYFQFGSGEIVRTRSHFFRYERIVYIQKPRHKWHKNEVYIKHMYLIQSTEKSLQFCSFRIVDKLFKSSKTLSKTNVMPKRRKQKRNQGRNGSRLAISSSGFRFYFIKYSINISEV